MSAKLQLVRVTEHLIVQKFKKFKCEQSTCSIYLNKENYILNSYPAKFSLVRNSPPET